MGVEEQGVVHAEGIAELEDDGETGTGLGED